MTRTTLGRGRGGDAKHLREALLVWYDAHARDLPWRHSRDPYAIWISETMLQQTRVDTAIPYYHRFLERFPDIESLAVADRDDVYGEWAGLGYYSRARNLQRAAQTVVEDFGGRLPGDAESLQRLPGIGRYTAGAVASIAFGERAPVVDGNVARVLTRIRGIREDVKSAKVVARLWEEAGALVDGARPGDLNQALMELGATLCTPKSPDCGHCPVARGCDAKRVGDTEAIPVKSAKKPPTPVQAVAVWLERRGRLLAVRRKAGGLLGGLWGPPGGDLAGAESATDCLRRNIQESVGLELGALEPLGEVTHTFTHRALRLHLFACREVRGRTRVAGLDGHRWTTRAGLDELPQSTLARKTVKLLDRGTR